MLYIFLVLLTLQSLIIIQGQTCDLSQQSGEGRIWTIATGHDWGAYEYFDETGFINGFSYDIINAVCAAANMDCRIVWDKYTNCWDSSAGSHPTPGKGLMGGWYDACTGWGLTIERMHAYDFTLPYLAAPKSYFYVSSGTESSFNVGDLSDKKIAFFDGWYSDEKCLARQGSDTKKNYILDADHIIHVTGPSDVIELFNRETKGADAVFAGEHDMQLYVDNGEVVKIDTAFSCVIGGHGMMIRKDSDFADHWNKGFQKLRSSGQYHQLCKTAKDQHKNKGLINCNE